MVIPTCRLGIVLSLRSLIKIMTLPSWEELKTQAIVEALEYYIYRMKKDNANEAAIELYMKILKEIDPQSNYTVIS